MTLRIGVLGYRFMGRAHASAFARLPMFFPDTPDIERSVIVGRDENALADAADRLGFERAMTDWEAAIDDVDVFYNLGPNHVHVEPSVHALEADVHTFCEKPLAPTLDGAERMADAAASTNALSAAGFNYRFVPALRLAKELVDEGVLGDIYHVRGRYLQDWLADPQAPWSWRNDAELSGSGVLGDLGAHSLDLARWFVGDVDRVSGNLRTFVDERPVPDTDETRDVTVDDAYSAHVEFENGVMGTFEASRVATGHKNDNVLELHGTDGSLRFELERLNELQVLDADSRGYETILVTDPDDPYLDAWWPPGHILGWEHTFVHENHEFLTAIDEDGEHHPNFQDGLEIQRILEAIQRSDETGEWVTV